MIITITQNIEIKYTDSIGYSISLFRLNYKYQICFVISLNSLIHNINLTIVNAFKISSIMKRKVDWNKFIYDVVWYIIINLHFNIII